MATERAHFVHWPRVTALAATFIVLGVLVLASPALPGFFHTARAALTPQAPPEPISRYHMAFKHLGFGGLSTCTNANYPMIARTVGDKATTFLVKASVPCGLEVRNPSHFVQGTTLHLSYETHFTCSVDMCNCEYRSAFAFGDLPSNVNGVEFKDTFVDSCR